MTQQTKLIREIKALQVRHAKAEDDAERFSVSIGLKLAELKERKPKGTTWPAFVKKHFGYSQTRADQLIRIGTGADSVEKINEKARSTMRKVRAKSAKRFAGSKSKDNVVPFTKKPEEGDCNYNPGDPDHIDSDTPEETRRIIFLNMVHYYGINEPTKVLDEAFFPEASPEEATDDLFVEIEKVIAAWKAIAAKLRTLKGARSEKVKVKA